MKQNLRNYLGNFPEFLLAAVSGLFLILLIYVFYSRVLYPYDIEWAEGLSYLHAVRILEGLPIYTQPSIEFSALPYTPGYFYLSALVMSFTKVTISVMRMISALSALLSGFVIAALVRRETKNQIAVWVAPMMFWACYSLGEGFLDLARVDSLFLLSVLVTYWMLEKQETKFGLAVGGLLLAGSFFIKQTAVVFFLPLMVFYFIRHRKQALFFVVPALMTISGGVVVSNLFTEGWFNFFVFTVPSLHGYSFVDGIRFWVQDLFQPLGITLVVAGIYFSGFFNTCWLKKTNGESKKQSEVLTKSEANQIKEAGFHLLVFTIGVLLGCWITRTSNGGASNNVLPFYAVLAVVFGRGFAYLEHNIKVHDNGGVRWRHVLYLAVVIQFFGLLYNPFRYIPRETDLIYNQRLEELIQDQENEVLAPYRSHLIWDYQNQSQVHMLSLFELLGYFGGDIQEEGSLVQRTLKNKIANQEFGLIILDYPMPWFDDELRAYYQRLPVEEEYSKENNVLSWQTGLSNVYMPRQEE